MKILVTGGAGFIGSNLVKALLKDNRVTKVRVLDNLATGHEQNISEFYTDDKFEFIRGDIRDFDTCIAATNGMDRISHQAALGSVPRSIKDPLTSNDVNVNGTLNIFHSAVKNNIDRVVFAASSSTYGDSNELPKVEDKIGKPLSPYAVTKLVNELYAEVFARSFNFGYIGLRYFNVFGPKQDPNGAYAAVIPLFFKAAFQLTQPIINGDGSFSRDFTYIDNVVQANLISLFTENQKAINNIYNIAVGNKTSLNELWSAIRSITESDLEALYGPQRDGDIPHSLANITKAQTLLNYHPKYRLEEGLKMSFNWYKNLFL